MIKQAAVVGAGLMGRGIAKHLADHGARVTLLDTSEEQLALAAQQATQHGFECTTDMADIREADFVIEAVFEDVQTKRQVLSEISTYTGPQTTIATNTSSLLIRDLAGAVQHPERFIGVHYNNPADFNPVVEIIGSDESRVDLMDAVEQWMRNAGKLAVRCADTPCFILNRQSLPYINEAARCLDIATPGEIDFVATNKLKVGLGPFAVMNLVGLPVMAASSRNLTVLGEGYAASKELAQQAEKTYPEWQIDPVNNVAAKTVSQILQRLRGAMIFPGKDILDHNLCSRDDLHKICIEALGYDRSSVELLEVFEASIIRDLLTLYLSHQR